jgi:hypothetical protein
MLRRRPRANVSRGGPHFARITFALERFILGSRKPLARNQNEGRGDEQRSYAFNGEGTMRR